MFKFIFEFVSITWSVFDNPLYDWVLFAIFGAITHVIVFNLNPFRKSFGSLVYCVCYTILFGILYLIAHFIKWYLTLPFLTMIGVPILIIILIVIKECEVFKYQSKKKKENLTSKS